MGRAVLQACSPWLALLAASAVCAYLLIRLNRSRVELRRLMRLHGDQRGSAQSLSFVLTLPLFVMIIMFIVQVSQLMIGTIVVHYAAFATARSAIVWIPAYVDPLEGRNSISSYVVDPEAEDQVFPTLDPEHEDYGPVPGGLTYRIEPGSPKYEKITSAAVLACMPISPSRDLGIAATGGGPLAAAIIETAYAAMDPDSLSNRRIPVRLRNKLAYAMENTEVEIRFFHNNSEPPLVSYLHLGAAPLIPPEYLPMAGNHGFWRLEPEFQFNELGWQDQITVTVKHKLALLPGPGRMLARRVIGPDGSPDSISETVGHNGTVYVYPLEASMTLGNEGEKSVIPYAYRVN